MAPKITSSSDRSKRQSRSKATVRSDKGRSNRQKVSTAKTTNSKDRKSTGTAKVTTSKSDQKKLPPKGGTTANSPKAQYQRGVTRDQQAKQALTTISRGTSRMVRRMNAQDKQEAAAKGTQGTRQRVATGTPNRPQLPPAVNRPPAKNNRGGTSSSRVEQVTVRDVTKKPGQLSAGSNQPRTLPGSRSGASLPPAKQGPAAPSRRQTAQAKADAATRGSTRQTAMSKATSRGIVGGSIAGAILSAPEEIRKGVRLVQNPGKATKEAVDNHMNSMAWLGDGKSNSRRSPNVDRRPNKPGERSTSSRGQVSNPRNLDYGQGNYRDNLSRKPSPTPPPKTANQGQATRQAEQRRSVGATTAAPAPRQSPVRPSQSQPRSAASGTAGTGRKWEDFNTGRGTSETNNPLIKKDPWLMSKLKEREDGQAKNVGPVKDGGEYSASKKAAEIVERRKKKEEEEKKKAAQ